MAIRMDQAPTGTPGFLIDPYVPTLALTLLTGWGGVGKTHLAALVSARLTLRLPMPWESEAAIDRAITPREVTVLWATAESTPATLRSRLEAYGADLGQVMLATPDEDLGGVVRHLRPRLVVLDPLEDVVGLHGQPAAVRARLRRLIYAAREGDSALLAIRHQSKASRDPRTCGVGSYAVGAWSRSELLLGRVRDDEQRIVLLHTKSNDAPDGASQEFEFREGRLEWRGRTEATADDILGAPPRGRGRGVIELAQERLLEVLADGPLPQEEVSRAIPDVAPRTLREAFRRLGGDSRAVHDDRGQISHWEWSLPLFAPADERVPESLSQALPEARVRRVRSQSTPPPQGQPVERDPAPEADTDRRNSQDDDDPGAARFRALASDL
ncbi:MAG: AAA family ATPase [Planctomycetota bacterium]